MQCKTYTDEDQGKASTLYKSQIPCSQTFTEFRLGFGLHILSLSNTMCVQNFKSTLQRPQLIVNSFGPVKEYTSVESVFAVCPLFYVFCEQGLFLQKSC